MSEEQEQRVEQAARTKTPKLSAERALPQSGADVLVKIIKGYVVASNAGETPVKYSDVASATGLGQTTVSANNSFLSDSQILASPKYGYYVPSEEATKFAREAAWDEDKAKNYLRKVVARCWYGQVVMQNLALRPSLSRLDLKKSLAIKAGATEGDASALERLMDFIVYTGLVNEDNAGTLTKGNLDEVEAPTSTTGQPVQEARAAMTVSEPPSVQPESQGAISVVFHVHIRDWSDLTSENAVRLRQWLNKVGLSDSTVETEVHETGSSS